MAPMIANRIWTAEDAQPCYANGRIYREPLARYDELESVWLGQRARPCLQLERHGASWPEFWGHVQAQLRQRQFQTGTLRVYRQVLRTFRAFISALPNSAQAADRPANVTPALARKFVYHLVENDASWSWLGTNIAVLRTAFDKLSGRRITVSLQTPRRRHPLPDILSINEVTHLLESAPCLRDRLIIGLLYGCGLKVGELRSLRWNDIDLESGTLRIVYAGGTRQRRLVIPEDLRPVLEAGIEQCPATDHIFPGAKPGHALTARTIERMIHATARSAGLHKSVHCMTLRHSYAVARLDAGDSARALQEDLGHRSIDTTLNYQRCILPKGVVSPLTRVRAAERVMKGEPPVPPPLPAPASSPPADTAFKPSLFPVDPAAFPFPEFDVGPRRFYRRLKTLLKDRFLALRGHSPPG